MDLGEWIETKEGRIFEIEGLGPSIVLGREILYKNTDPKLRYGSLFEIEKENIREDIKNEL